jgi:hypothetical protein
MCVTALELLVRCTVRYNGTTETLPAAGLAVLWTRLQPLPRFNCNCNARAKRKTLITYTKSNQEISQATGHRPEILATVRRQDLVV